MGPPEKERPTPDQLAGKTGNGPETNNPEALMGSALGRLGRYGTAKTATLRTMDTVGDSAALKAGLRVGKIRDCGSWLMFRHFPTLGQTKLRSANFCSTHLVCGFCAIRRGARMMAKYLERFQAIKANNPELNPYLVTYTVKNGDDLSERLKHLQTSLTRLHKRRHGKRSRSELVDIDGAVWSYEVTYSEANGWHPHVHAIYLAKEQPSQAALRSEWENITVDSFMVDVRPITADESAPADVDPHAKGFAEVFKYALKAAELPASKLIESYMVLRGKRLVRAFGKFFGVVEPDNDDLGDELPASDLPYIDLLWRYSGGRYEHARTTYSEPSVECEGRSPGDASDLSAAPGHEALSPGDLHRGNRTGGSRRTCPGQVDPLNAARKQSRLETVFRNLQITARIQTPAGPDTAT
uniref:Replication protein n=1 Tax=uncultured prokaryote TaxID=198431 RepID=A0A0H5PZ22_9ZZZZ|nr:hypothetical protein [uncultured prokaryote]